MTTVASPPGVAAAYDECEAITRREARNFHYGIRLLAPDRRSALSAVYALARRIDDIGDGDLPAADKRRQLAELRAQLDRLDDAQDPVLVAVADAARRLPLPLDAFHELIDGVELDLAIDTEGRRLADVDELVGYCRSVAGSIGRLCVGVFGARDPLAAPPLADTLGIGLQQINILRDVREDLGRGRIYLPQSDLDALDVTLRLDTAGNLMGDARLDALIRHCAQRARRWYDDGLRLVPLLDRRSASCTLAMAGIYSRLLDRIVAEPAVIRDRRLSLPGRSKTAVALLALLGRTA
jgi:phytoene synthase